MAFDRYGSSATEAGVAVIPAMGFDYVPGDMIAALTAAGLDELDELALYYCWQGFTPSQGTARTTLEILSDPGVEWREGNWRPAPGGFNRGRYEFPAPVGPRRMIRYPAGEQITVPRHVRTRKVTTQINAGDFSSDLVARGLGAVMPPVGMAMRSRAVRRAAGAVISRLPEGPSPEHRARVRWTIVCEARRGEVEQRGVISGRDVYGLTAAAICQGATIAAGEGFAGNGALAPSQAFDPKDFLAGLDGFDLRWTVEGVDSPLPVEA
jgi:short subunit dehydrogenase-like uncharacterized protein